MDSSSDARPLNERLHDELIDAVDEELEIEIDDDRLNSLLDQTYRELHADSLDRHTYFRELLRLQKELVKLKDWVAHQKLKLMILFEGRDAAGKGGVIKRITQRLNPRICKVVALPAPSGAALRQEEVLNLPSMPAAGPSYPAGPYRFINREYMVITYETDSEVIRAQLPARPN